MSSRFLVFLGGSNEYLSVDRLEISVARNFGDEGSVGLSIFRTREYLSHEYTALY